MPATVALVAAVVVAGLVAIPAIAPAAAAAPMPSVSGTASDSLQTYGNVTNLSFQGHADHGVYYGNVTYGFVVNTTEANTSANVTEVSVQETVGVAFDLTYCQANCTQPSVTLSFRYVAWETRDVWANLTDQANVSATANGTTASVAAVGLLNASAETHAGLNETAVATVYASPGNRSSRVYSVQADASYDARSSAALAPALGLFPVGNLSLGETWSSTAAYLFNAAWNAQWTVRAMGPHGSVELNGTAGTTVGPLSGNVTLTGAVQPAWERFGTHPAVVVVYRFGAGELAFDGPFAVASPSLPSAWGGHFGGSWQTYQAASAQVGPSAFELDPAAGQHSAFEGSMVSFSVGVTDTTGQSGANQSGLSPSSLAGAPMSSTQASRAGACLQSGTCATSSANASTPALSGLVVLLATVGVIAAVLVGVLVFGRRGRTPPASPPSMV